jgi:hypothetical protein
MSQSNRALALNHDGLRSPVFSVLLRSTQEFPELVFSFCIYNLVHEPDQKLTSHVTLMTLGSLQLSISLAKSILRLIDGSCREKES